MLAGHRRPIEQQVVDVAVQINNVGANEFTGGITWLEVPLGGGDKPLLDADKRTRRASRLAHLQKSVITASGTP